MDHSRFTPATASLYKYKELTANKAALKIRAEETPETIKRINYKNRKSFTSPTKDESDVASQHDARKKMHIDRRIYEYTYNTPDGRKQPHRRRSRSVDLPDRDVQIIKSLDKCGTPHETISQSFNISVEQVKRILQPSFDSADIQDKPSSASANLGGELKHIKRAADQQELYSEVETFLKKPKFYRYFLEELKKRSQRYRCAMTNRMMSRPILASDGRIYEEHHFRQWLSSSNLSPITGVKLTETADNLHVQVELQEEARDFARSTMLELSICIKQDIEFETTKELTAEFLSVLDPADDLESYAKMINAIDQKHLKSFLGLLFELQDDSAHQALKLYKSTLPCIKCPSLSVELLISTSGMLLKAGNLQAAIEVFQGLPSDQQINPDIVDLGLRLSRAGTGDQAIQVLQVLKPLLIQDPLAVQEFERLAVDSLITEGKVNEAAEIIAGMVESCQPSLRLWMLDKLSALNLTLKRKVFLQNCIDSNILQLIGSEVPSTIVESLKYLNELYKTTSNTSQVVPMDLEERANKLEIQQANFETSTRTQIAAASKEYIDMLDVFRNEIEKLEPRLKVLETEVPQLNSRVQTTSTELSALKDLTSEMNAVNGNHINYTMAEDLIPKNGIIYSYEFNTKRLCMTELSTGEQKRQVLDILHFDEGCQYAVLPRGNLFFTGGIDSNRVWVVKTNRNFSVVELTPMHKARNWHGSVYFRDFVYVIGGEHAFKSIGGCERYDVTRGVWRTLPDLPQAVCGFCPVVIEPKNCLYVLGGRDGVWYDLIQYLDIEKCLWNTLELKLPQPDSCLPCFKMRPNSTSVLFLLNGKLLVLRTKEERIQLIRNIGSNIYCNGGPSYFYKEHIYCSSSEGYALKLEVGSFLI